MIEGEYFMRSPSDYYVDPSTRTLRLSHLLLSAPSLGSTPAELALRAHRLALAGTLEAGAGDSFYEDFDRAEAEKKKEYLMQFIKVEDKRVVGDNWAVLGAKEVEKM